MSEAVVEGPTAGAGETLLAVRNAFRLGGSLLATWGVALAVRIMLPRHLGPELFGALTFADAFTTLAFVPLGLGLDTYIRKEVATRPAHASDFFAGTLLLRAGIAAVTFAVVAGVMALSARPAEVRLLVYLYGAGQVLVALNTSLAALLHARGRVGGLSVVNVLGKLVWAGGILVGLATGGGLFEIGVAFLGSEALKAVALSRLAHRTLALRLSVDWRATWLVLLASLPFFVNTLAHNVYAKLDVNILSFAVDDATEVGWYGAASSLAGLTLLITPLIGWVLGPLFARALERNEAEFDELLRRSVELVLAVAVPTSLVVSLGADLWISVMFGSAYLPATASLRLLAPVFVLTYVATLSATAMVQLGRGWALTKISLAGMGLNLVLNLGLAPLGHRLLGPAGGGVGCALALVLTEGTVTAAMLYTLGGRSFDRRSSIALAKSLAAVLVAIAVHQALGGMGPTRLVPAMAAYLAVVVGWGALPLGPLFSFARDALRGSHGKR